MRLKINHKAFLILAYAPVFTISIVMFITFMCAYLNGGSILITINSLNEANIELICIPITLILSLIGFKHGLKRL